jgi:hypothetical protein
MTPTDHPLVPDEGPPGESPQTGSPQNGSREEGVTACKRCGGVDIALHGTTRGAKQRLRCRTCGATFLNNLAPPGMRFSTGVIAAALELFYGGATLKRIVEGLAAQGHASPNYANIHRWIVRYSKAAVLTLAELNADVGSTWLVVGSEVESRSTGGRPA